MRRRPPHLVVLSDEDRRELHHLVRNGRVEQRVARRARVLLAMAEAKTLVDEVARRSELTRSGIWRVCRRYEERGLEALWDAPRSGRPWEIPPLGAGANRAAGVL